VRFNNKSHIQNYIDYLISILLIEDDNNMACYQDFSKTFVAYYLGYIYIDSSKNLKVDRARVTLLIEATLNMGENINLATFILENIPVRFRFHRVNGR
jgi:hypothetical protein